MLTTKHDAAAAKRFLAKMLGSEHTVTPRVINVDKSTSYPPAVDDLKDGGPLPAEAELRQCKYLK